MPGQQLAEAMRALKKKQKLPVGFVVCFVCSVFGTLSYKENCCSPHVTVEL